MNKVTVSVSYAIDQCVHFLDQIASARIKYVPQSVEVLDVRFEKEWYPGETKITFYGVEK